jgi:hypothetical protein
MPRNKPLKINMNSVWERFYRGDHIDDIELDAAVSETEMLVEMMQSRGPKFGCIVQLLNLELARLKDYQWGRTVFAAS